MRIPTHVEDTKQQAERAKSALPEAKRLLRPYRWMLLGGLALVLVTRLLSLVLPMAPQVLIDSVIQKNQQELLLPLVGAVVGASLLQAVLSISLARVFARAAQGLTVELRCRVQQHVLHLPLAYHDQHRVGTLVQRTMTDVQGIQNFLGQTFLGFFGAVITALAAYGIMLYMNLTMTLVATGMIAVFGLVVRNVSGRLRPLARRRAKLFAEISGRLTEAYGGIRVVKGYRGEEREQKVYRNGVEQIKHVAVRGIMLANLMGVASAITLGIAVAALLYIGARDMLNHTMTIGEFVSYSSLMGFLAQPVQQLVTLGQQIPEGLAGIDRMQELLANPREDKDAGRVQSIGPIEGHVAFEDLRFSYEASEPILKGLTFEAKPGTATAFVGPSGSGKSTAINLIAAFYKATSGKVLVDGTDLATVTLDSYRAQLGLVLQESFLFDGTILENVAFSRPNATREEILEACKRARVDEFATRLDKGWETQVGERGVKLSGGQRQRISIARALLANPRILILDEATSALDTQSEALIQEALEDLMLGRTTFVIAHRLSTIRRVDQILVIDKGQIVERGKHDELLAKQGLYWQMYTQQHAGKLLGAGEREPAPNEVPLELSSEGSAAS